MLVCFDRAERSAFQVKIVKGRVQILPVVCVSILSEYFGTGKRTFCSVVILQHLDVGVVREAVLADGGEVGRLPTGAVEVLLDLRRHGAGCGVQKLWHSSDSSRLCRLVQYGRK
jgi:hypothetical protein